MPSGNKGRGKPKRVCVVNSHPIQYYAPFYAHLARDAEIELEVFYLSDASLRGAVDPGFGRTVKWDIDLLAGYQHRFVGRSYRTVIPAGFFSLVTPELFGAIYRGKFDVVTIHGYAHAANLIAIAAARLSGARIFFRCDTNAVLAKKKRQSLAKRLFVKGVFAACHTMLTIGTRNREFYRWMGVPERKLVQVPFSVDNRRFFAASRLSAAERADIRGSLGIRDDRPALLFVSKFMPGKRPDLLVEAAGQLAGEGHGLHLVMAGSGDMEGELRRLAETFPQLPVSFPGFVNQSEMPRLLAACDVLIFPSTIDQWGLIVNEAMAVGMPVVVGADAGCAPDLVEDGINGYIVPSNDLDALRQALGRLVIDAGLRREMAKASLDMIETWSFRESHDGWREALGLAKCVEDMRSSVPEGGQCAP
ncbi:MAG: glycosyltransferase family 1 protein [Alphaproteobacteria bacterium HGW-Alphaproteobacteria-5]|nr:MAG: glycosyltransferase family 1 protein [Alphaproteobacteria bacterium HGW-Alphaproteobacteria-5]